MHEPLTTQLVAEVLEELMIALPRGKGYGTPQQVATTYRNALSGISGDALRWAAKTAIQEDKFFPKVARLRELAMRWTVANAAQTPTMQIEDRRCPGCGKAPAVETRWRPALDTKGWRILDGAGRLLLERFERVRCDCDAPARYFPDDPTTEYMTENRKPAA